MWRRFALSIPRPAREGWFHLTKPLRERSASAGAHPRGNLDHASIKTTKSPSLFPRFGRRVFTIFRDVPRGGGQKSFRFSAYGDDADVGGAVAGAGRFAV